MPIPLTAAEVLDREFLDIRARILDLAASFDRLDRAAGSVTQDLRLKQLREALGILRDEQPARAERVQLLFSLPYDANWRAKFAVVSLP